jgi:hypothetical protein
VRSGTNYLGKVMGCNPRVQLVPPKKTTDEFPMLRVMESWEKAFDDFAVRYTGDRKTFQFDHFLRHLGDAWQDYLIETFSLQPGHVFLKDPSVRHIDRFFDTFPEAKLILLVRDGRDNVASSVKAGLAIRSRDSVVERSKKRLNHLLFRDFVQYARDWSSSVGRILSFDEKFRDTPRASQYMIVRYEDVFRHPREMAERLFSFMGVEYDDATLDAVDNAEVVGSSFFASSGREEAKKPNWKATPKTDAFKPLGRWNQWSALQKSMFKRIAGEQLISMGYEKDLNWQ